MLVCRGDRPASMFLVARGEIKLMLGNSAGSERIVRLAGTGSTFCEESIFNDDPMALSAQAVRDSMVLQIPERLLQLAMAADAGFARALMRRMSERITQLVAGMEQCEQRNGTQRVAHYLVKNASRASEAIEVKLSTSKQTIASQLNMTPESLSRVLNRFKREGYIIPRGHRSIRLTDYDGLQSLAA
jgi:CRP-like cAMP-binding protein